MIYFTGDIHGAVDGIADFINKIHPTMEDVIVLLGDVGANYYTGRRDNLLKAFLNDAGTVFLCIHGNHERRPTTIPGYVETEWHGGKAWVQPEYPNLIFARDGEIYTLNGLRYLVIGGAYSVDKYYRLSRGWGWWPDEQPSPEIKTFVEQQILALSSMSQPRCFSVGSIKAPWMTAQSVGLIPSKKQLSTRRGSADIGIRTRGSTKCTSCSIPSNPMNSSNNQWRIEL